MDIGFWFTRVERGTILADKLHALGNTVTLYHNLSIPTGTYQKKRVSYTFVNGMRELFKSNHDAYFTTGLLLPALQLTIYKWVKKVPFVLGVGAPYWRTYNSNHEFLTKWIMHRIIYPSLFKLIMHNAAHIITNSIYLERLMGARYPTFDFKIQNIYNGVNYEIFKSSINRSKIRINKSINFITVGTANFKAKTDGLMFLINTIAKYIETVPDSRFTLAIKSVNIEEQTRLAEAIPINMANRIILKFNCDSISQLIDESDIFIYSTPEDSSDSLPRVLIEAQAMGIPTITTKAVGCEEVIIQNETGLVTKYDQGEILGAIHFIVDNPLDALDMAQKGKQHVKKVFNWDSMANKYQGLF
jgi:glycosyltransferase involved in cell wall biosynthesis